MVQYIIYGLFTWLLIDVITYKNNDYDCVIFGVKNCDVKEEKMTDIGGGIMGNWLIGWWLIAVALK